MDDVNFFANRLTEIFVGENAYFDYYALENTHNKTNSLSQILVEQQANSRLITNIIGLNNGRTRNQIEIDLNGEGAETWLGGMLVSDCQQQTENFTVIRHNVPRCHSNELFKYILNGAAEGAFSGRIVVQKGAQKTEAYQTNRNICLTKEARMFAKPQLEIYADDVKCGHGATTGQLDEAALFYMQTRGIGYEEARMLLLLAFTSDVLEHVEIDALRDRLHFLVEKRLRGEESKCKGCVIC
jgi:Fe-S cluster assembly protein SufD